VNKAGRGNTPGQLVFQNDKTKRNQSYQGFGSKRQLNPKQIGKEYVFAIDNQFAG
jgi:hypothetical protein